MNQSNNVMLKREALSVRRQHREPRRNLLISKLPFTMQRLMRIFVFVFRCAFVFHMSGLKFNPA